MSSRFTLVPAAFATLAALAVPRAAVADTFCGVGLQYLVALRCGEGGPVVLQCVPDALRGDICTLPHTVFAEAICRQETGCYSITDFPFDGLGVDIPDEYIATDDSTSPAIAAALFCMALPATIDASVLSSFESEDSFEDADPLATWTLDTSADPSTAIRVVCANDTPPAAAFLTEDAPTFTDLLNSADDGDCAAIVRAGCSEIMGEYGTPGTNSMSRQFRVFNRGCVEAEMAYELMFAVAFDDRERCETATVNDTVVVSVDTGAVSQVAAEFVSCTEGDSPKWVTVTVDLGVVPLGTVITPTFVVESTNDEDCFLDSFVAIDDIRIMPKK